MRNLYLLALAFFILGCCRKPERTSHALTDVQRDAVVYSNHQEIKFSMPGGDEIHAIVSRTAEIKTYDVGKQCAECCHELATSDVDIITFATTSPDIDLPIIRIFPYSMDSSEGSLIFTINSDVLRIGELSFVNGGALTCLYTSECLENLEIAGQTYDHVYTMIYTKNDDLEIKYYFTTSRGIVKIERTAYQPVTHGVMSKDEYFLI